LCSCLLAPNSFIATIGAGGEMAGWRRALAILVAILACHAASATGNDNSRENFLTAYQCSLSGLIAKILAEKKPDEQDRFVTLSLPGPTAAYVQCAFDNDVRNGLCEASSGWWNNAWEKPHFRADQLAALSRLGFSTDGAHGNFQDKMKYPPGGPDPFTLARLMLSALYEGYGAQKFMPIEVVAPFALRHGYLPQKPCAPIG